MSNPRPIASILTDIIDAKHRADKTTSETMEFFWHRKLSELETEFQDYIRSVTITQTPEGGE